MGLARGFRRRHEELWDYGTTRSFAQIYGGRENNHLIVTVDKLGTLDELIGHVGERQTTNRESQERASRPSNQEFGIEQHVNYPTRLA